MLPRNKLRGSAVLDFLRDLPPYLIGLEACVTGHFRAREISALGHEVRLIPPFNVRPYVKRLHRSGPSHMTKSSLVLKAAVF